VQSLKILILVFFVVSFPALAQTDKLKKEIDVSKTQPTVIATAAESERNSDTLNNVGAERLRISSDSKREADTLNSRSLGSSQPQLVHEAYHSASLILSEDNPCSRFFGGPSSTEALDQLFDHLKLISATTSLGIRMYGTTMVIMNAKTGLTFRIFEKAEINRTGAFFKTKRFPNEPIVPRVGSFPPATPEARVLMILHELGHSILGKNGKWLLPDDGGNTFLSADNTAIIEKQCEMQLRTLHTLHPD
jgi:hypothetical protein